MIDFTPPSVSALLVYSLVVWRAASLLVDESGPWRVFEQLRDKLGVTYDEFSQCHHVLCCTWCTSVWLALALALITGEHILTAFAASAGAILIGALIHGTRND